MQTAEGQKRTRLLRHTHGESAEQWDVLAEEAPLEIIVAHRHPKTGLLVEEPFVITMRTPGSDQELALGLIIAEGLISSPESVERAELSKDERSRLILHLSHPPLRSLENRQRGLYASSSCGVCGKADLSQIELPDAPRLDPLKPNIEASTLHRLPNSLRQHQRNFEETGGLHAAALFDRNGTLLSIFEDVGRHNALDKLIGHTVARGAFPARDQILLLSGRVSFELIQKATVAQIPIIAALGAPSTLAVDLAQRFGQTLVGFLREDRFNIYTHPQRITNSHE